VKRRELVAFFGFAERSKAAAFEEYLKYPFNTWLLPN
jgi:hypothetical protein